MKTSIIQNSKLKIKKYCWAIILFPILSLAVSTPAFSASPATPTDAKQIKKKLLQDKRGLAEIQKKLNEEKKKQKQSKAKEKSVLGRLQKVDKTLMHLRREKETNENDLQESRRRLNLLSSDISRNQAELAQSRQLLKQRLLALYRKSFRAPFLGGILDSESFADLTRKLKFELLLAESNGTLLSRTFAHERQLEQASFQWQKEQSRKQRILGTLGLQEKTFSKERQNRAAILSSIRSQQVLRQQVIEDYSRSAQQLQQKVALLLHQAKTVKQKASHWYSSGTGLTVRRGRIHWPVSGKIISPFGRYKNPEINAVMDNTGIQIQAPPGTPIHAVGAGLVRYADWFKGYGKLVILDHGQGYYSLYAQASELDVSEGQMVEDGQVIGAVGDTGSLVGSSLYFEIRRDGVPQDPMRWLQHRM